MTTLTADRSWRSLRSHGSIGILLVVISTVAIAIVPSLARLAYDGGTNPLTLITVRSIVTALVGLTVLLPTAGWRRVGRAALWACLAAGVCYAVMLYGFLAAVRYLPVNTVILIYFVHPIVLAVVAARLGDERVTGPMLLAEEDPEGGPGESCRIRKPGHRVGRGSTGLAGVEVAGVQPGGAAHPARRLHAEIRLGLHTVTVLNLRGEIPAGCCAR